MSKIRKEKMRIYMDQKVRPLFDQLFTDILVTMPEDVINWSVKWL